MSTNQRRLLIALGSLCAASLLLNVILIATRPSKGKKNGGKEAAAQVEFKRVVDSLNAANEQRIADLVDVVKEHQGLIAELKRENARINDQRLQEIFDTNDRIDDLRSRIDDLIALLEELKSMKMGKDKNDLVKQANNDFSDIIQSYSFDSAKVKIIKDEMSKPIMKEDDSKYPKSNKVVGQYNTLIGLIKELKHDINK